MPTDPIKTYQGRLQPTYDAKTRAILMVAVVCATLLGVFGEAGITWINEMRVEAGQ